MDVSFTNVLEGARQYFQGLPSASAAAGPYYGQQTVQHEQQQQQPQPHNQQQISQLQHSQHQQPYYQQNNEHYADSSTTAAGPANASWMPQHSPPEPNRAPSRERTPTQRPLSHSSAGSRPPSHSSQYQDISRPYHSPYPSQSHEHHVPTSQPTQPTFQFTRPQSREVHQNPQHYQQQTIVTNSSYHQPVSPQSSRLSTREQLAPAMQSYQQQSGLAAHTPTPPQYNYPSRSYYATSQAQPLAAKSEGSYMQSQSSQAMYYKQNTPSPVASMPNKQNSYIVDNRKFEASLQGNDQYQASAANEQSYRATHNLPPIAALSNYRSNKAASSVKEAAKGVGPRTKVVSSVNSYCTSIAQPANHSASNPYGNTRPDTYCHTSANAGYGLYNHNNNNNALNQNNQRINPQASSVITQTCSNVIMATANTSHYSTPNNQNYNPAVPYQRAKVETQNFPKVQPNQNNINYQQPKIIDTRTDNIIHVPNTSVIKQRKEIPLDLSVKTVRTSADSTEGEAARNKYFQNKPQSVISSHSYPTLDVNSIERSLTQRSQLPTATAPKVEFHPNFNLSSRQPNWNSAKISQETTAKRIYQEAAKHTTTMDYNSKAVSYQPDFLLKDRYPPSTLSSMPQYAHHPYENRDLAGKRPGQIESPAIPTKMAKVENWRESINLQIEEKITSHVKQQQLQAQQQPPIHQHRVQSVLHRHKALDETVRSPLVNGNYPQANSHDNNYPKQSYVNVTHQPPYSKTNSSFQQPKYSQSYVPSNTHYSGYYSSPKQSQPLYINPAARHNSSTSVVTIAKPNTAATGADKRVLSLLRNSIEIKEQKKIEQLKSQDLVITQRTDIQHPNTDVTAPLQPKPGIDRRNISPFTPISVPDPNICKMPPKVVIPMENSRITSDIVSKLPNEDNTVIMNNSSSNDYDGLAAFLAARIRTKGELKELAHHHVNSNAARDARIQAFLEDTMKSPNRQNMLMSSSSSMSSTSPPKPLKDKQATRKKLFNRNDEELGKLPIPSRDKSSIRSSSETSVFDFPDSDDENEMPVLERQTLDAMRRDRRNSLKLSTTPLHSMESEIKLEILESTSRAPSPDDYIFGSICDTFMEQLRNKPTKRVKRILELEPVVKLEPPEEFAGDIMSPVKVKKEFEDDSIVNSQKEDAISTGIITTSTPAERNPPHDFDLEKCKTPIIIKNVFRSDSEQSDSEIKSSESLLIRNRHRVRRKIISSSESEAEEEKVHIKIEQADTVLDKNCDKSEGGTEDVSIVRNLDFAIKEPSIQVKSEQPEEEKSSVGKNQNQIPLKSTTELLAIIRPAKKPSFGDGSDFYPGWEEGVYKYKKSLRMPPSLIQLTRPPMRLSTSLPDLDPCPQSPTTSITTDIESKDSLAFSKKEFKSFKSESVDSDSESTCSFNIFSKRTNYDSEGSSSIQSLPNTRKENILDKLLEKCGGRKKKKHKRKDDHSPKITPKADNPIELLATPTPSLALSATSPEKSKGLTSPVISTTSAVLPFRKDTVNHFKDAFINSGNSILGVHDKFTTIVLSSRTRKETRAMKQRVTIKEVFGEDRPASAPPVTCVVNEIECDATIQALEPFSKNLQEIMVKREKLDNEDIQSILNRTARKEDSGVNNNNLMKKHSKELFAKELLSVKIKKEFDDDDEDENKKLIDLVIKKDLDACSETMSLDSEETGLTAKRKNKFGKMRRKFSSGFDYIRKKKKVKKEDPENGSNEKKKKKSISAKTPESIDDIQKEIKNWVLNKGVGESHLHRAARLGYVDITAFCLDKMNSSPSPKDNAGYTPLHEACARGHLEIAKLLLKYGANVHEAAKGGIRPLHEAIENGFVEVVRLLLSYGADPSLATYAGLTPISLATDENMKKLLKDHLSDKAGEGGPSWPFNGPSSCFDPEESGYNVLADAPLEDSDKELEDIEIDMSEGLLPNLYILREESPTDRWVLLQDLSHFMKIKSRDALLRQISSPTGSNIKVNHKNVIKELKMTDFLEQAHCCQFLNMGEKINTRASKIALVKYTDRVKELLGIESAVISAR